MCVVLFDFVGVFCVGVEVVDVFWVFVVLGDDV